MITEFVLSSCKIVVPIDFLFLLKEPVSPFFKFRFVHFVRDFVLRLCVVEGCDIRDSSHQKFVVRARIL